MNTFKLVVIGIPRELNRYHVAFFGKYVTHTILNEIPVKMCTFTGIARHTLNCLSALQEQLYFGVYTQRNIFEILLNQTEIRLHLPFFD